MSWKSSRIWGRWIALCALAFVTQTAFAGSALGDTTPTVSSVTPAQGSVVGGERVTINGSGFVGPNASCSGQYQITFGFDLVRRYAITPSSYQVLSDTQISVVVPPNFGGPVSISVHNACGWSPDTASDRFTYDYPADQCRYGTCSISISSAPQGTLGHVGVGFLDGFNAGAGVTITPRDTQLVDALRPRQWRLGQAWLTAPGGGVFGLARQSGARISVDLTTDWENWAWNQDHAYFARPYGDLSTYYSFIYNDVKQRMVAGQVPDYFDVWNEPVSTGSTVNEWLSVYGTAYQAIKAADPSAQVVGPSIDAFLIPSSGQPDTPGYQLSLTDFLNWEMTTGDRFAAISWHEDGATVDPSPASPGAGLASEPVSGGYRDYWSPAAIATHILAAKALLAQYPALSGTQIFVNEYGPTYAVNVPGWMVGDFQALESAGADEGMITCPTGDGCNSLLDGLIGFDGSPQMPYWVMKAYSQMTGSRLGSSSSGTNLYTLATRVDSSQTIQALVGRADDCFGGVQCPQFHAVFAAPVKLSLTVAIPWALKAVNVAIQALPNRATDPIGHNDVATAPQTTVIRGVAVYNGKVTATVPAVYDGDALYITLSPGTLTPGSAGSAVPGKPGTFSPPASLAPGQPGTIGRGYAPPGATAARAMRHKKRRDRHHHRRHRHLSFTG